MSEELKPCPCCKYCDPAHDLTMPTSVADGIEYVVCQLCGLRVDAESWNLLPRIPEGFALVPVEPSEYILNAGYKNHYRMNTKLGKQKAILDYHSMIAAAQDQDQ